MAIFYHQRRLYSTIIIHSQRHRRLHEIKRIRLSPHKHKHMDGWLVRLGAVWLSLLVSRFIKSIKIELKNAARIKRSTSEMRNSEKAKFPIGRAVSRYWFSNYILRKLLCFSLRARVCVCMCCFSFETQVAYIAKSTGYLFTTTRLEPFSLENRECISY